MVSSGHRRNKEGFGCKNIVEFGCVFACSPKKGAGRGDCFGRFCSCCLVVGCDCCFKQLELGAATESWQEWFTVVSR